MELSELILRILVAMALGASIGLEREYRDKGAGFRTMIMISVGSALFTVTAMNLAADIEQTDPTRMISYIISGIGFLGAGAIIKDGVNIRGLTTASTIWLVAGIGIAAGSGFFLLSTITAALMLFALIVLPPLEHRIDNHHEHRRYEIEVKSPDDYMKVMQTFNNAGLRTFHIRRARKAGSFWLHIDADGATGLHHAVADKLIENPNVLSF